jgi:hypothetical protein
MRCGASREGISRKQESLLDHFVHIHDGPEHKGSNKRPDTVIQGRTSANSKEPSCNALPDHTLGHPTWFWQWN